jgi:hypothetical protein
MHMEQPVGPNVTGGLRRHVITSCGPSEILCLLQYCPCEVLAVSSRPSACLSLMVQGMLQDSVIEMLQADFPDVDPKLLSMVVDLQSLPLVVCSEMSLLVDRFALLNDTLPSVYRLRPKLSVRPFAGPFFCTLTLPHPPLLLHLRRTRSGRHPWNTT